VDSEWETRISHLWATIDHHEAEAFVALVDRLAGALPPENAVGLFERASALDSTGHSDRAAPLYDPHSTRA